jgi:hypothetical protein
MPNDHLENPKTEEPCDNGMAQFVRNHHDPHEEIDDAKVDQARS